MSGLALTAEVASCPPGEASLLLITAWTMSGSNDFSLRMLPGETLGDFCGRIIMEYLKSQGFDIFDEVHNKSGNDVGIVAENTKSHKVKVVEVKGTQSETKWNGGQSKVLSLSKAKRLVEKCILKAD